MNSLTEKLIRHRKAVLLIGILATLFWGLNLVNIRIDGSFTTVLPETDPDFLFNRSVEAEFGSSDEIIILIRSKEKVFTEEVVNLIEQMTDELSGIDNIDRKKIVSMLSVSSFTSPESAPPGEQALRELEDFMKNDPLVSGSLLTADGRTTMIMAPVSGEIAMEDSSLRALVNEVEAVTQSFSIEYPDIEILL